MGEISLGYVLLNGVTQGILLALLATAYSLTFGVLRIINFALGEAFMLGAVFFSLFNHGSSGNSILPWSVSLLASIFVVAAIGGLLYFVVFYWFVRRADFSPLLPVVASIGLSLFIQNAVMILVDSGQIKIASLDLDGVPQAGAISAIGLLGLALVGFFTYKSAWGSRIQAVRENRNLSELYGLSPRKVGLATFAVSYATAATAGLLSAIYWGVTRFDAGFVPGLKGFSAAVVGGIGDVAGAMLGGLVLGMAESLASAYVSTEYKDVIAFVLLVVVLITRPRGLLGRGLEGD